MSNSNCPIFRQPVRDSAVTDASRQCPLLTVSRITVWTKSGPFYLWTTAASPAVPWPCPLSPIPRAPANLAPTPTLLPLPCCPSACPDPVPHASSGQLASYPGGDTVGQCEQQGSQVEICVYKWIYFTLTKIAWHK